MYNAYRKNPAMNAHCSHGNRYMLWLPYLGWEKNKVNVTYFGSEELLTMNVAWRKKVPITSERPWCVIARFGKLSYNRHLSSIFSISHFTGYELDNSMLDSPCDLWDSKFGWDRAPCSACTIHNQATKSIEFQLRGNCEKYRIIH